jgi:hypothetical protein
MVARIIRSRAAYVASSALCIVSAMPMAAQSGQTPAARAGTVITDTTPERADSIWRTERRRALPYYAALHARHPENDEYTLRLATLLSYERAYDDALDLFRRYLTVHQGDGDARAAMDRTLRWRAADAPAIESSTTYSTDSDHNTARVVSASVSSRLAAMRFTARGTRVALQDATSTATSSTMSVIASLEQDAWTLRFEGGANARSAHAPALGATAPDTRARAVGSARLSGALAPRIRAGISASSTPFDGTVRLVRAAAIDRRAGADVAIDLTHALRLDATGAVGDIVTTRTANRATYASASLTQRVLSGIELGVDARGSGFAHVQPDYFAPARFIVAQPFLRVGASPETGWRASGELAAGAQWIRADSATQRMPARRAALMLGYSGTTGAGIDATFGYAEAASPAASDPVNYHGYAATLRVRAPF